MRTITIDILDEKVLPLLKDLEQLKLIRLQPNMPPLKFGANQQASEETASKQALGDIENQINELRNEWE